jgi:hypothetical protein
MLDVLLSSIAAVLEIPLRALHLWTGSWPLGLFGLAVSAELVRGLLGLLAPGRRRTREILALRARHETWAELHRAHPEIAQPDWLGGVHLAWAAGGYLLAGLLYAGMVRVSAGTLSGVSFLWLADLAVPDPTFVVAIGVLFRELIATVPGKESGTSPLRWVVVVALTALAAVLPAGVSVLHLLRALARLAGWLARVAVAGAARKR